MKAQDIIPDGQDFTVIGGRTVRKGSVGAFLANARILEDASASAEDKQSARQDLHALVPTLDALGLFDVFELRCATLREELEEARARHHGAALSPSPAAAVVAAASPSA
jgi:hypothetical protein